MITEIAQETDAQCARSPVEMLGTWFVAQVLSRHEKRVARAMTLRGIPNYLPLYENEVGNLVPLCPAYLFVCSDVDGRYELHRHDSVYGIIDVKNQPRLIRELSGIHRAIETCQVRPYTFPVKGQKVQVTRGPMYGTVGIVVESPERRKFILKLLESAVEVHVDPELLEVVD
jgi:hypothetical protein